MKIGKIIRNIRKEQNLTQLKLAKKAKISNSYLSDIERGRTNPSIVTLVAISNVLNISDYNIFFNM